MEKPKGKLTSIGIKAGVERWHYTTSTGEMVGFQGSMLDWELDSAKTSLVFGWNDNAGRETQGEAFVAIPFKNRQYDNMVNAKGQGVRLQVGGDVELQKSILNLGLRFFKDKKEISLLRGVRNDAYSLSVGASVMLGK